MERSGGGVYGPLFLLKTCWMCVVCGFAYVRLCRWIKCRVVYSLVGSNSCVAVYSQTAES